MKTTQHHRGFGNYDDKDTPLRSFEFNDSDKTPSWKTYGEGYARLRIQSHVDNPYLSMTASESSKDGHSTKGVRKEVMLTLDAEQGRALYAWLKDLYEVPR